MRDQAPAAVLGQLEEPIAIAQRACADLCGTALMLLAPLLVGKPWVEIALERAEEEHLEAGLGGLVDGVVDEVTKLVWAVRGEELVGIGGLALGEMVLRPAQLAVKIGDALERRLDLGLVGRPLEPEPGLGMVEVVQTIILEEAAAGVEGEVEA